MTRIAFLSLALSIGCATKEAESPELPAAELELVCFAEQRSGAIERFPFADKAEAIRKWLDERLKDPRMRTFYFEELPQTGVDFQDDRMREAAAEAGIERCPMAGYLEFTGKLPREGFKFADCVAACTARHSAAPAVDAACRRGCGG
ncbi:MAG TPA: hypothetical protein VFB62_10870 [Polyangiaceae bacterium]|jgi:hypothetical protein|nr:hypothetical protein [Polyangiaceae bacterium]